MYTRQLPASGTNTASGYSTYGGDPGYSAHPNPAAYRPNPGLGPHTGFGPHAGFGSNSGFAGPVTYIYQPIAPTNTVAIVGMVLSLAGVMVLAIMAGVAAEEATY